MSQTVTRNFSIIAHIDHGKTTLTDRLLEVTGTVNDRTRKERLMDSNPIEQERGITIKLAPVRMEYTPPGSDQTYTLNLIDTPGHVDFGYEVSRSLAAGEGAILLIDATQGIQAQTLANYEKAQQLRLKIIPVLNKVDLPSADVEQTTLECMESFGVEETDIISVSAKTGQNVEAVLQAVVDRVPAPTGHPENPLRALIFTSLYDEHKGVIAYVRVVDGQLAAKTNLRLMANDSTFSPIEIGVFKPDMVPVDRLSAGQVGYIATGLKELSHLKVGDTLTLKNLEKGQPQPDRLPGYQEPIPMVFLQFYPVDPAEFVPLQDAVAKLQLHDASLQVAGVNSLALGSGLRIGFLGVLHAEVARERLEREFGLSLVATSPTVTYQVTTSAGDQLEIHSPSELPDPSLISQIREPMTKSVIFAPQEYVGAVMKLCQEHRGELVNSESRGLRTRLEYRLPLAEIIVSFFDKLKSVSSGYASLEYKIASFEPVEAVKLDILINKEPVEALSSIVVRDQAELVGRAIVAKLKEVLPRQMFEVPVQAAIGGTVVARETIKAFRKDVTAKLYGGDVTRRKKLLAKQAKGKKKMKAIGKVELPQEAFMAVLSR